LQTKFEEYLFTTGPVSEKCPDLFAEEVIADVNGKMRSAAYAGF